MCKALCKCKTLLGVFLVIILFIILLFYIYIFFEFLNDPRRRLNKQMEEMCTSFEMTDIPISYMSGEPIPLESILGEWYYGEGRYDGRMLITCEVSPFLDCVITPKGPHTPHFNRKAVYILEKGLIFLDKPMFNDPAQPFQLLKVEKDKDDRYILREVCKSPEKIKSYYRRYRHASL